MAQLLAYSASGKYTWGDVVLIGGGILVAFGLIFGFVRLLGAPGRKHAVDRREAVAAAAAAADPVYSVDAITRAASDLFNHAAETSTDGTLRALEAQATKAGPVWRGPKVDVVGLVLQPDDKHAAVHIEADIGTKYRYTTYERYWTITHGDEGWSITKILTVADGRRTLLREPIVTNE